MCGSHNCAHSLILVNEKLYLALARLIECRINLQRCFDQIDVIQLDHFRFRRRHFLLEDFEQLLADLSRLLRLHLEREIFVLVTDMSTIVAAITAVVLRRLCRVQNNWNYFT